MVGQDNVLVSVFAANAVEQPDTIAVVDGIASISYRVLSHAAETVRERLVAAGAGPGVSVGVAMDRSWRLIAAIIGIMAAGANYVPLDARNPLDRLQFICADCSVGLVCADLEPRLPGQFGSMKSIRLIPVDGALAESGVNCDASESSGYIIYTSGSTGRPKGVLIPQGHVISLFDGASGIFDFRSSDVWSFIHSYGFDFSVWEIWGTLIYGGRLVVFNDDQIRDPRLLLPALEQRNVSVLCQVPTVFKYLVREYVSRRLPLLSLRYVIFGGEALDKSSVRRWLRLRDGPEMLVNMYGITETTVHVTYAKVRAADLADDRDSCIGRPLPHLRVVLLAANGGPVPTGQVGEMYIAGATLSPGYVGRPDITAERFVTLDLGDGPERYYRSGDLASMNADGELFYRGRLDYQLNVHGLRIEAGEVEAALRSRPSVRDAFVTAVEMPTGDANLIALVVPEDERQPPSVAELKEACAVRLPTYMIPDRFETVAEFPAGVNGKRDQDALTEFARCAVDA
jgi:amino acid adenylation domain-containing protein